MTLMARPEIKSFADLKGKTVALTVPYDLMTLSMRKMMEQHGIRKEDMRADRDHGLRTARGCLRTGDCVGGHRHPTVRFAHWPRKASTRSALRTSCRRMQFGRRSREQALGARPIRRPSSATSAALPPRIATSMIRRTPTRSGRSSCRRRRVPKRSRANLSPSTTTSTYPVPAAAGRTRCRRLRPRRSRLMGEYGEIPKPVPPTERFIDLRYAKAAGVQ